MDTSLAEEVQQTMATLAPNRFFFMSPYRSFTTSGCFARFDEPAVNGDSPDSPFQQKLAALFADAKAQGIKNPVMVGAIPFDPRQPSSLYIPESWQSFFRQEKQASARRFTRSQSLNVVERQAIPEQTTFEQMVARAAALTATPQVDKVVLSRLIDITTDAAIDSGVLLERLIAQNPVSYNFHVPLADGGVLLGASPELLLRKDGERFSSIPLAGSARRQPDEVLDREAGNRLLASEKDRHEHELVTQAMKEVLRERSSELHVPSSPQLITTPTLWHLATPFEGKANSQENALTLACLLHPTSPELLLRKDGERFSSIPLAGSARRQPDEVLDREAGNRLLASEKDRHEHELVTQAMKEVLRERSSELHVPSSPQLITTPTLWHLATPFEGKANSQENALTLACLLHPTPALSGFPHQAATQVIAELEPFDRELFGGIVGWCDSEGNGEWVVTIRCAKLRENQVRLFAGAGIVPASSPLGEWRETGVKLSTMLNVFGLH